MSRKQHEPSDKDRAKVKALSSVATPRVEIAKAIGIDYKTLMRHYEADLVSSAVMANANIAQKLLKQAADGDKAAAMFWMKEQAKKTDNKVDLGDIDDPLVFLKCIWSNNDIDVELRMAAARSALPYTHGKIAEKGKKETKEDAAKAATKSGKFGTLNNQLPS
ncbi:hypothetical protein [Acinetobacter sp.]|uniref:hypothetical protein n=1 Tax=Acinetobacter sp. TaxID=472 RepID=UPI00257A8653|nr:hypothetical protein [Acinetobacter sp.]